MGSDRKPRGRPLWTGDGPLYRPGAAERNCFLDAISRRAPEVIADLQTLVLTYDRLRGLVPREMAPRLPDMLFNAWRWGACDALSDVPEPVQRIERDLHEGVIEWARRYRVLVPWMLEVALRALDAGPEALASVFRSAVVGGGSAKAFEFRFQPWFPQSASKDRYVEAVTAAFRVELEKYFADVIGDQRFKRASSAPPAEWFDWLVMWQCCKMSCADIANEFATSYPCGVDESTYAKAIHRAAESVGFSEILRPHARGRQTRQPE